MSIFIFKKLGYLFSVVGLLALSVAAWGADKAPVLVGLDAEFGHKTSTSAQAVQEGIEIAIDEINRAGGVLNGRPLQLVVSDNRSIPAVGVDNLRALAARPDLVAVFGAKFSPVLLAWVPVAQSLGIPIMATWSSADPIVDNGYKPNYVFRLSLKDAWAAPTFLRFATQERHAHKVGLLLPNTGWGRSNEAALKRNAGAFNVEIVGEHWYNWGDKSLIDLYQDLRESGAQAIIFIANEVEGAILVKEIAELPESQRLPLISHWGVAGGAFFKLAGPALAKVDYSVVQTYSFIGAQRPAARRVLTALHERYGVADARAVAAPVGVAQAYDLTHLLARAIDKAGSTDRSKIRDAMEQLGPYDGLIRHYSQPFTPQRHDALSQDQVFMARFDKDGALIPIPWSH